MTRHPRFPFFISGCVVLILMAIAHCIATVKGFPPPTGDDQTTLMRLMTTLKEEQTQRTMLELYTGFNWFFTLAPIVMAVAGFSLLSIGRREPSAIRRVALVYTFGCAAFLSSSLVYWFIAPTSFLALATLLFLIAAVRDGRTRAA